MVVGVLPKANLIALALCVLMFSLRCNKALGVAAAIAFSFVGPWTDPFAHKLGLLVLEFAPLQQAYASILNMPLGPWLGFNNTVVIGSLLAGLYIAYPTFWLSRKFFATLQSLFGPRPAAAPERPTRAEPRAAA